MLDGSRSHGSGLYLCCLDEEIFFDTSKERGHNEKADLWSFGITALELAYGQAPFARYPPMKVLVLTLQNPPPTLERNHPKRKYSRAFQEMTEMCLQKDPAKRPTAEKLLEHSFFKQAKKPTYLIAEVVEKVPSIERRQTARFLGSGNIPSSSSSSFMSYYIFLAKPELNDASSDEESPSWDFNEINLNDRVESSPSRQSATTLPQPALQEPKRIGRFVVGAESIADNTPLRSAASDDTSVDSEGAIKKGRFVVESSTPNSSPPTVKSHLTSGAESEIDCQQSDGFSSLRSVHSTRSTISEDRTVPPPLVHGTYKKQMSMGN